MTDKNIKKKGDDEGNDPDKKPETSKPESFDPKALGDEDFQKVFDDPRLWEHKRFKELNDRAKEAKELKDKIAKAEEKELEKQKKFEELAEKRKLEADEAKKALQEAKIENAIQAEATKQGAGDLEAVTKLVDRSKIEVDENGTVTGVDKAVESLVEAKPYLKNANVAQPNIGTGTQPNQGTQGGKKFTLSQIQDPAFYRENEADIDSAIKAGNVIDDTPQPQQ